MRARSTDSSACRFTSKIQMEILMFLCKLCTPHKKIVCVKQSLCCVEVLRPSHPSGVMLSMVSLPNHTITGQA